MRGLKAPHFSLRKGVYNLFSGDTMMRVYSHIHGERIQSNALQYSFCST